MPVTKTWAGGTYNLPLNREPKGSWGTEVSNFLIALANNAVSITGGTQTLSAELNFGANFGVVEAYVKSAAANIASAGFVRMAVGDLVAWRNNANGANLTLGVSATDKLQFNGTDVADVSSAQTLTNKTLVVASNTVTTAASGNLASTELNAALAELQGDIDTRATSAALTTHTSASSAHGVTGAVVGTSDAQTLTSKTIDGASNTLTVRLANDVTGTLPVANGGTGQATASAAINALLPSQSGQTGNFLTSNGISASWANAVSVASPPGIVLAYAGTTAPTGYLMCDGTAVSRTTYAALFAAIGSAHGSGNGSTTFNLPDLRGRFIRGTDNMGSGAAARDPDSASRTAAATGGNTGNNVGSVQSDQLVAHTHQVQEFASSGWSGGNIGQANGTNGTAFQTTTSTGGNETRPKNAYLNYIIKT